MIWIYTALLAYLISAFVFIIDKYLLHSPIPKPFAYAFWISVLSGFVVVLIPFGVTFPEPDYLAVTLLAGLINFIGLVFLYSAVRHSDVSIASTKVGTFSILSSYLFSVVFFGSSFSSLSVLSVALFSGGIFLLAKLNKKVFATTLISGIFIGLSLALVKWAFEASTFINGIFWTRAGFALGALFSLTSAEARKEIMSSFKKSSSEAKAVFVSNKVLATVAFLILYYSIKIGDVTVVNSLLGFQFLFILILAVIFRHKFLKIEEKVEGAILARKIVAISFIILGFILLLL